MHKDERVCDIKHCVRGAESQVTSFRLLKFLFELHDGFTSPCENKPAWSVKLIKF